MVSWLGGLLLQPVSWVKDSVRPAISAALVQPDIPLSVKWDRKAYLDILRLYQDATAAAGDVDLVLWPESALPQYFQNARGFLDPIAEQLEQRGSALITGIPWRDAPNQRYFNSIVSLGNGEGVYHKQRLVPFGEYVPLESWLRGLIEFFDLPMSSFSAGPKEQELLTALGLRVAPYICYEVVYPDLVAKSAAAADFLVTISNDSWFGTSIGPIQHLQMAQMRALENGRYLLRGTNNGVTAIIDHRGDIVTQVPQFTNTTLFGTVQIMEGKTPFTRLGSAPVLLLSLLMLAAVIRRTPEG